MFCAWRLYNLDIIDIDRQLIRSLYSHKITWKRTKKYIFFYLRKLYRLRGQCYSTAIYLRKTFLSKKKILFINPFLCNFMRPKTSNIDFSKKRPKSIMPTIHSICMKYILIDSVSIDEYIYLHVSWPIGLRERKPQYLILKFFSTSILLSFVNWPILLKNHIFSQFMAPLNKGWSNVLFLLLFFVLDFMDILQLKIE